MIPPELFRDVDVRLPGNQTVFISSLTPAVQTRSGDARYAQAGVRLSASGLLRLGQQRLERATFRVPWSKDDAGVVPEHFRDPCERGRFEVRAAPFKL